MTVFKSFQVKIMLLILTFIFSAMLAMFYFVDKSLTKDLESEVLKTNMNYAQGIRNSIDLHMDALIQNLIIFSELEPVKNFDFDEIDALMKRAVNRTPIVSQMYITDSKGMQVYKTSFVETLGDRSDRDYFRHAIEGDVYISDAIISRSTKMPICVAVVPIYKGDKVIGTLGASIELSYITKILSDIDISQNGYGVVVDRNGHIIADPQNMVINELVDLSDYQSVSKAIADVEGYGIYEYDGKDRLLSYTTSLVTGWTVLVQLPVEEAFVQLHEKRIELQLFILLLFGATILLSVPITKKVYGPIKDIKNVLSQIGKNDYKVHFKKIRGDEFGMIQNEIEKMATELAQTHEDLEYRVQERTDELNASNESLKEALYDLRRVQDKLVASERLAALNEMGLRMSHEINTSIGNSLIATTFINSQSQRTFHHFNDLSLTQGMLREYIESVMESSSTIQKQLEEINETIRILRESTDQKMGLILEKINLYDCIQHAIKDSKYRLVSNRISIEVECDSNIEVLYYNGFIEQIIIELINNSVRYAFNDKKTGTIRIHCERYESHIYILFEDDGDGMPQEMTRTIFEPFKKSDMANSGRGIGLSYMYNLIVNVGRGEILCESALGIGTEFEIYIPHVRVVDLETHLTEM